MAIESVGLQHKANARIGGVLPGGLVVRGLSGMDKGISQILMYTLTYIIINVYVRWRKTSSNYWMCSCYKTKSM